MTPKVQGGSAKTEDNALLTNVEFLLEQAILEDEAGHFNSALDRYKDTAQLCLRSVSLMLYLYCLHYILVQTLIQH